MEYRYTVAVRCFTYNQAHYIEDALRGFAMQETDFPVVNIIVDDASTDGEQDVIKSWAVKNLDVMSGEAWREMPYGLLMEAPLRSNQNSTFVILLLSENHYQTGRSKMRLDYVAEWYDKAKYHSLCEGDDYWIDYQYLQKKIDILESDDGISMVCNKTACFSQKQKCIVRYNLDFHIDRFLDPKDLIMRGGGYVATCSMVYRKSVVDNYPDYCVKCHVGDYPRQIMCGMKGKVYYLSDTMTVYRVDNSNSWVGKNWGNLSWVNLQSEIDLLSGFSHDFPSFYKTCQLRKRRFILQHVPNRKEERSLYKEYKIRFDDIIRTFGFKEKILFYINSSSKKELIYRYINKFISWKNV